MCLNLDLKEEPSYKSVMFLESKRSCSQNLSASINFRKDKRYLSNDPIIRIDAIHINIYVHVLVSKNYQKLYYKIPIGRSKIFFMLSRCPS